jgi:Rha family phage regulatory protein
MSAIELHSAASLTMTSREIAELTGKEHRNVMADIRKMLEELHGTAGPLIFQQSYRNSQNKEQPEFCLPKRETLILVSGYSVAMRARIIDRWQELEAGMATKMPMIPQTLPEALRLAADLAEQKAQAEAALAIAAPKADALDRLADADGAMNPTLAAKTLQVPPKKLFTWLREKHWIYRRPGSSGNVAYQDKIQAGYLTHKITTVERDDGSEKIIEQVLVTGKGLAKISQVLGVECG